MYLEKYAKEFSDFYADEFVKIYDKEIKEWLGKLSYKIDYDMPKEKVEETIISMLKTSEFKDIMYNHVLEYIDDYVDMAVHNNYSKELHELDKLGHSDGWASICRNFIRDYPDNIAEVYYAALYTDMEENIDYIIDFLAVRILKSIMKSLNF